MVFECANKKVKVQHVTTTRWCGGTSPQAINLTCGEGQTAIFSGPLTPYVNCGIPPFMA